MYFAIPVPRTVCGFANIIISDDYEAANVSLTSVATVANSGGKDNFPDVVVSHTCVREMAEPKSPEARFAWEARLGQKVTHQCFPIIVELKRAPSRPLRDGKFTGEVARLLGAAETQLCYYIAVQLERDPYAPSVIAISGSGGWWRWAAAPLEFWSAQEDQPTALRGGVRSLHRNGEEVRGAADQTPRN